MNKPAPPSELNIWTIYDTNTLDFPGMYVARLFKNDKPTDDFYAHEDLEAVRTWVRDEARILLGDGYLYRLNRASTDDPVILETWI